MMKAESLSSAESTWSPQNLLLAFYFFILNAATSVYLVVLFRHPDEWAIQDWFVNYAGGFVRRGLAGAVTLEIGSALHTRPQAAVCIAEWICFTLLFWTAFALLKRRRTHSLWTWALILSPATFAFQLLDTQGGFRKEILLFAGLAALLLMLRRGVPDVVLAIGCTVWIPIIVLAHESTFFYLGYYAAAVLIAQRTPDHSLAWGRAIRILALPAVVAIVTMGAVSTHTGNPAVEAKVCIAIQHAGVSTCGEAIQYIGYSPEKAKADMAAWRVMYPPERFIVPALLTFLPLAVILISALRHPDLHADAFVLCVAFLFTLGVSLPLYIFASDWGRWMYMHAVCLSLLIFYLGWEVPAGPRSGAGKAFGLLALAIYTTFWTLPHYAGYRGRLGYMERVEHSHIVQRLEHHR